MPLLTPFRIALASTVCALVTAPIPNVAASDGAGILGATFAQRSGKIVRLDPLTLEPVGRSLAPGGPLATIGLSWSALRISGDRLVLSGGASARILDPATGRIVARVPATPGLLETASARGDRLIAVAGAPHDALVIADGRSGRVIARRPLGGELAAGVASNGRLVLLVGPATGIGATRLVRVSASGGVRSVVLPGIDSGTRAGSSSDPEAVRSESPALAVDPTGARAAVVDGDGRVAIVDLRSLKTVVHRVVTRRPAAARKEISGWQRSAAWLTPSVLAVTGMDYRGEARPAGLRLIRAGSFTSRLVQPYANELTVANGAVLAIGNLTHGIGLRAYEPDGRLRYHRFGAESLAGLSEADGRLYISGCNSFCYRVVDPATGRLLASPSLRRQTVLIP